MLAAEPFAMRASRKNLVALPPGFYIASGASYSMNVVWNRLFATNSASKVGLERMT